MPIGSLYTDLSGSLGCARGTLFSSDDDEINDLRAEANLAAWYDASNSANLTVDSVGRVSQWNDTSMFASRHLLQGTAGSQPVYLGWSGQNYGYCPGVSGNYFSTPDSAALDITGDMDMSMDVVMEDWSPLAQYFISKWQVTSVGSNAYVFGVTPGGLLEFSWSPNGTTTTISAISTAAVPFADGTRGSVRVTLDVDNGSAGNTVTFYTATTYGTWTQLGAPVVTAGVTSIANATSAVNLCGFNSGASSVFPGRIFYAQIRNGINGTVVAAFDPSRAVDGATSFVAATGETWTVNSSGGKPAQIVGRSSVLFDGVDDFLKTAAFTLNQPETVYVAMRQITWSNLEGIVDGDAGGTFLLQQGVSTPNLYMYAGSNLGGNPDLVLGRFGVVTAIASGSSSVLQVNRGAPLLGNAGALNMGGVTLGASGAGTGNPNIQVSAVAIFAAAHDARTRARVINYLVSKYSIPV